MKLSNTERAGLRQAMLDSFTLNTLGLFLDDHLDIDVVQFVDTAGGSEVVFQRFILWAEQTGRLIDFLRSVLDKPKLPHLHPIATELIARAQAAAASGDANGVRTAQLIGTAVRELGNLLSSPEAGAQIASSRGEIERLCRDIGMLTRYKKLHDCLHQIQLKHYRLLMDAVRRFRTDPLSYSTLQEYLGQLRVQVADARSAAEGLPDTPTARQQETLWIDTLELVVESLRKALTDYEEPVAAEGILRLKGILRVQPARLNQFLALTAKGLPLEQLRDTLEQAASALDPAQTGDLQAGIGGLSALIPDLRGKVQEHLAWQDLERDLWQTEDILHQGNPDTMDEFWFLWPAVKSRMQALTAVDPAAEWAADIERGIGDFDAAYPANAAPVNPMRARNAFDQFRGAAVYRFYLVDKSLLEKCEQVTLIRQPLNELLEKIPHA